MAGADTDLVGLGARIQLFAQPSAREALAALFRDELGCDVQELDFGLAQPILLVQFENESSFSVELTELAQPDVSADQVRDASAFRGAWIEFRTTDLDRDQKALRRAGIPEFRHAGSDSVYFSAPGGQVFRLVDDAVEGR